VRERVTLRVRVRWPRAWSGWSTPPSRLAGSLSESRRQAGSPYVKPPLLTETPVIPFQASGQARTCADAPRSGHDSEALVQRAAELCDTRVLRPYRGRVGQEATPQ
jgi:hypothetical protein